MQYCSNKYDLRILLTASPILQSFSAAAYGTNFQHHGPPLTCTWTVYLYGYLANVAEYSTLKIQYYNSETMSRNCSTFPLICLKIYNTSIKLSVRIDSAAKLPEDHSPYGAFSFSVACQPRLADGPARPVTASTFRIRRLIRSSFQKMSEKSKSSHPTSWLGMHR